MNSKNIIEVSKTNMVSIRGEIDIYSIEKFRDTIEEKIKTQTSEIILDCSESSYMDSTGMGVLIELRNKTKELGQKIIMMNPRPNIRKLLALTGVDKIIEIVDNPVN